MAIVFLVGVAVGIAIMLLMPKDSTMGVLRIDRSDPFEGPQLFLELKVNANEIAEHDTVTFKVLDQSYITRD